VDYTAALGSIIDLSRKKAKCMNTERVVIGATERAGWPISAPVTREKSSLPPVRWVQNPEGYYYELQAWSEHSHKWESVPCFIERQ
jgi:hypothetical protein